MPNRLMTPIVESTVTDAYKTFYIPVLMGPAGKFSIEVISTNAVGVTWKVSGSFDWSKFTQVYGEAAIGGSLSDYQTFTDPFAVVAVAVKNTTSGTGQNGAVKINGYYA